ncbi:hypothetical protein [Legionella spiritensis]|uniref:Substrate of the Dot/Icm secretion system n=1 Tax=Legionella spiritensis TaxID=452 RepID=A0A0W0Z9K0_LEGSP|nr:hypothetical protein [Legionella spiritensis]KTD65788.1 hypothetical protein Lspi_0500 [Legionella spiritensis]SNV41331.1 Uncharacterised protein [Legionella spiritensis]
MPYKLPAYEDLITKTDRLGESFNQLSKVYITPSCPQNEELPEDKELIESFLGRIGISWEVYQQNPGQYGTYLSYFYLRKLLDGLEETYKAKNREMRGIDAEPDHLRLDQISFLIQLRNNLPDNQSPVEADKVKPGSRKLQQAFKILLGGILWRYHRLENSYKGLSYSLINTGISFLGGTKIKADTCSALRQSLTELLGVDDENPLDDWTNYTCLNAFQSYMSQKDVKDKYNYIKSNKKQFDTDLDSLINKWRNKIQVTEFNRQHASLEFIQSVADTLTTYDTAVDDVLKKFEEGLEEGLEVRDSKAIIFDFFSREEVAGNIAKQLIVDIWPEDEKNAKITAIPKENITDFVKTLRRRHLVNSIAALFGAYLITKIKVIRENKASNDHLISTLNKAIGLLGENRLSSEDLKDIKLQQSSLIALENFIGIPKFRNALTIHAWSGHEFLSREIGIAISELNKQLESLLVKNSEEPIDQEPRFSFI